MFHKGAQVSDLTVGPVKDVQVVVMRLVFLFILDDTGVEGMFLPIATDCIG